MIWIIIDSSSVGGAERHVANLAESLRRSGHDAEVILFQDHGANPWLAQLAEKSIPARTLDGTFAGLLRALRTERPALLHAHGYKAGILGRVAARLARIPVVTTFHSGLPGPLPVGAYERVDAFTAILGETIAVSEAIQKRLPFRSTHIPNYIHAPTAPVPRELPRRIAFVGRLSDEKGPDLFCQLAERIGDAAQWHVYGDGPMRASLEARYGGFVRFHGVVTGMDDVWPTVGLLLMPSRWEGLPYVALEALGAGVPVAASRVGAVPTVIAHGVTGWLFESGDLDAAEEAISAWLALPRAAADEMRLKGWQHVAATFSETAILPRILEVYRKAGAKLAVASPAAGSALAGIVPGRR